MDGYSVKIQLSCNWLVALIHFVLFLPTPRKHKQHAPKRKALCQKSELILIFIKKEKKNITETTQTHTGANPLKVMRTHGYTGSQRL